MNYLDAYDVTTNADPQHPKIEEEVAQITGQLGRLWGGFRKQVRSLPIDRVRRACSIDANQ
jgi:hypothetical protein